MGTTNALKIANIYEVDITELIMDGYNLFLYYGQVV